MIETDLKKGEAYTKPVSWRRTLHELNFELKVNFIVSALRWLVDKCSCLVMNQCKSRSNTHWYEVCVTCVCHAGIRLKSMVLWFQCGGSLGVNLRPHSVYRKITQAIVLQCLIKIRYKTKWSECQDKYWVNFYCWKNTMGNFFKFQMSWILISGSFL